MEQDLKKNKQELLEETKALAIKYDELKSVVLGLLEEMDKIEIEYNKKIQEIKKN
jgi:hypothetical protein